MIKNIHGVYIVDNLRDPWNTRTKLDGLIANNCIYLDSSQSPRRMLSTFIHELSHTVVGDVEEKEILRVEKILHKNFTRQQKEMLEIYIACAEKKEIFY